MAQTERVVRLQRPLSENTPQAHQNADVHWRWSSMIVEAEEIRFIDRFKRGR